MATDNQRLVSFLPSDLRERFKQFCDEHQLKTTEAIQQILTEYFNLLPSPSSENGTNRESHVVSREEKLEILDRLVQRISALENSFAEMLERTNVPSSVQVEEVPPPEEENINVPLSVQVEELPPEKEQSVPEVQPETQEVPESKPKKSSKAKVSARSHTIVDLAKRLGVNKSTVSRNLKKENFVEWSSGRDPEGISWEYREKEQLFYPMKK
jgi:hypothetical protein